MPRIGRARPYCRTCGSDRDYYTAGRCRRCHRLAPIIDSCRDCLGWGVTRRHGFRCQGCAAWRRRPLREGDCLSCARPLPLNARGCCRLCSRQTNLARPDHQSIDIAEANRHGQQLFIVDLFRQKRGEPAPATGPPRETGRYPLTHEQLVLFEAGRDLRAGRRAGFSDPPLPDLAAMLEDLMTDHAARHGWSAATRVSVRSAIRVLLATQQTPGAVIKASDVAELKQMSFGRVGVVIDILDRARMLDDDRRPTIERWFAQRINGLPEAMADEYEQWFEVLRDGRTTPPRSRPRTRTTVQCYITATAPILQAWSDQGRRSLREISRQDIVHALPLARPRHRHALVAMRSMFRFLKARRLIFTNPTTRIRGDRRHSNEPLPMSLDITRDAVNGDNPVRAALAALVAFHALRPHQLNAIQLTDVADGRLHLSGRTILLADPARRALSAW